MEEKSYSDLTQEATTLMRQNLPEYVVNCFIASGYDTLQAVSTIGDENLQEIEEFINSEYPQDERFISNSFATSTKFLPGHKRLIMDFVENTKQNKTMSKGVSTLCSECTFDPDRMRIDCVHT